MRNTTTVVIAAGAVLAAVIVTKTPAQQEYVGSGACCYPGGCLLSSITPCLQTGGTFIQDGGCAECPPPPGPTVIGTSVTAGTTTSGQDKRYRIFRTWSDGQVDSTLVQFEVTSNCVVLTDPGCGPVVLLPGTCPTDIDRDGDTGINDFLTLLGGWGACR